MLKELWAYLFSLAASTVALWFSAGFFANTVIKRLWGHEVMVDLLLRPYYPLLIGFGILTGYLTRSRWKHLATPWVWILTGVYLLYGITSWLRVGYGLEDTLKHFFGRNCWPSCQDQYEWTLPFYGSLAYSLGVSMHKLRAESQHNGAPN